MGRDFLLSSGAEMLMIDHLFWHRKSSCLPKTLPKDLIHVFLKQFLRIGILHVGISN